MVRVIRPTWVVTKVIGPLAARFGRAACLVVVRAGGGRQQRLPVRVLEVDGRRYLVAVHGETRWVRDLRAAGDCELRRNGWVQRFSAIEVPPTERAPLIAEYRARWSRLFPERPDHPVFELRPAGGTPPTAGARAAG